jgi:hypothetical protein
LVHFVKSGIKIGLLKNNQGSDPGRILRAHTHV